MRLKDEEITTMLKNMKSIIDLYDENRTELFPKITELNKEYVRIRLSYYNIMDKLKERNFGHIEMEIDPKIFDFIYECFSCINESKIKWL